MTLVDFKLPPARFLEILRVAVQDTRAVTIPDPPGAGRWKRTVNYRQVIRCLEGGELVTDPAPDAHGNWQATLRRFSAGVMVIVTVALAKKDEGWHIYVVEVNHE